MNKRIERFTMSKDKTTLKITRRQAEYLDNLALRTDSKIPTERQLLDYCPIGVCQDAIYYMQQGIQVEIVPFEPP